MADLDFTHNVQQIPAAEALPKPIQRSANVETQPVPDFQGAVSNYAAATNWMSTMGSYVATKAANERAKQLGTELGKNPQGDVGIPLTEFDEVMQKSYDTQAQATLGLQASKLISDSNLEAASAPRMSSDLIAQTNKKITIGLQNIFKYAPADVRTNLEHQYGGMQISQVHDLGTRLIREQREDRKNNTDYAIQNNAEIAYTAGLKGDEKTGQTAIKNSVNLVNSDVGANVRNKADAKERADTVRKSFESGKVIHDYEKAKAEGKEAEFTKSIADRKYKINDVDYNAVTNNLLQYVNHQNNLRSEYESLKLAQYDVALKKDPSSFEANNLLSEIREQLSPLDYQRSVLKQLTALKQNDADQAETTLLKGGWSRAEVFSRADQKVINKSFDDQVRNNVTNGNMQLDEAESVVASQAAGPVPRFTNLLNTKLSSINPADIESGLRQMNYLYDAGKGGNLSGVKDEAKAMAGKYQALRRAYPPQEAAKMAYESVYNRTPEQDKILKEKWSNFYQKTIKQNPLSYYSSLAGFNSSDLSDPIGFQDQTNNLMQTYFDVTHGDIEQAQEMVTRDIASTYGDTFVNGVRQVTYFPIEKIVELPTNDVRDEVNASHLIQFKGGNKSLRQMALPRVYSSVGLVQEDIIDHVSQKLSPIKKDYDEGHSSYYWEIEPRASVEHSFKNKVSYDSAGGKIDNVTKYANGEPIVIHQVYRNGTRDTYTLMVKANPYLSQLNNNKGFTGAWDVVLQRENSVGYSNLTLLNQNLQQHIYYKPDATKIRERYLKYFGGLNE
jgi:hypothetical protein